jgi:hypothetical protein
MEFIIDFTVIGTGITTISSVYMIIRNFKTDINSHIDRLEKRMDLLDERMFMLATGKSLADAIKEEKMKRSEG